MIGVRIRSLTTRLAKASRDVIQYENPVLSLSARRRAELLHTPPRRLARIPH